MSRLWLAVPALALVAGIVWWRGRDGSRRSDVASRADHSRDAAVDAPAPVVRAPAAPGIDAALPSLPPIDPGAPAIDPAALAASVPFDREVRDPAWAVDQERELRLRLDRIADDLAGRATVTIAAAECRRTLCRIEVAAPAAADLSALYGALETPEGLYGWADTIVLGEVVTDPTGAVSTEVLASFDR